MFECSTRSPDTYASLAKEAELYYEYLEDTYEEPEDIVDIRGDVISYKEYYMETVKGVFSYRTLDNIAEEGNLAHFMGEVFGNETEIPDWAGEYFEDGDYAGLVFEIDRDSFMRNE